MAIGDGSGSASLEAIKKALALNSKEWASPPDVSGRSAYGQPHVKAEELFKVYRAAYRFYSNEGFALLPEANQYPSEAVATLP